MASKYARLDRWLSSRLNISRNAIRPLLASGAVQVNGHIEYDRQCRVGPFDTVEVHGRVLQACDARYVMLNKPQGVVSATSDEQHTTVLDLLPETEREGLHIAGRLDFNSTGLVLLTNDGVWSKALSLPSSGMRKHYRVVLEKPVDDSDVRAFAQGMWFDYEKLTTRPAELVPRAGNEADVFLCEGRYHQVRRMFAQRDNRVVRLHRVAVGSVVLDARLAAGESRALTVEEVRALSVG